MGHICEGCGWEEQQKNICMTSDLPDNSLDSVIVFYYFFVVFFFFPLPSFSKEGRGVMAIIFIKITKGLALPWYPHYALFLCLKLWGTFTWAWRAQTERLLFVSRWTLREILTPLHETHSPYGGRFSVCLRTPSRKLYRKWIREVSDTLGLMEKSLEFSHGGFSLNNVDI